MKLTKGTVNTGVTAVTVDIPVSLIFENGLTISLDNGRLKLHPARLITAEIKEYIVEHKTEIIAELTCSAREQTTTDSATKDLCACEPAPSQTSQPSPLACDPEGRPWPTIDLRASGAFLHKEFNRVRRALRVDEKSKDLLCEYSAMCDRIDDFWNEKKFQQGWYYG